MAAMYVAYLLHTCYVGMHNDLTLVNFGIFRWLLCVATMSSLAQHSYKFEMDTEKQRQCRRDNKSLTKSGNARSKQPTESLTNRQWLPGELLSGLKC